MPGEALEVDAVGDGGGGGLGDLLDDFGVGVGSGDGEVGGAPGAVFETAERPPVQAIEDFLGSGWGRLRDAADEEVLDVVGIEDDGRTVSGQREHHLREFDLDEIDGFDAEVALDGIVDGLDGVGAGDGWLAGGDGAQLLDAFGWSGCLAGGLASGHEGEIELLAELPGVVELVGTDGGDDGDVGVLGEAGSEVVDALCATEIGGPGEEGGDDEDVARQRQLQSLRGLLHLAQLVRMRGCPTMQSTTRERFYVRGVGKDVARFTRSAGDAVP